MKAGSMGLNYVRQDQTVPGAARFSAGPRCDIAWAAFGERRRDQQAAGWSWETFKK